MPVAIKMHVLGAMGTTLHSPHTDTQMTASNCVADVLAQQAVTDLRKWMCLMGMVGFMISFGAFVYVILLVDTRQQQQEEVHGRGEELDQSGYACAPDYSYWIRNISV
jgi:hypothetical protein